MRVRMSRHEREGMRGGEKRKKGKRKREGQQERRKETESKKTPKKLKKRQDGKWQWSLGPCLSWEGNRNWQRYGEMDGAIVKEWLLQYT
jgi:hypothetical protein